MTARDIQRRFPRRSKVLASVEYDGLDIFNARHVNHGNRRSMIIYIYRKQRPCLVSVLGPIHTWPTSCCDVRVVNRICTMRSLCIYNLLYAYILLLCYARTPPCMCIYIHRELAGNVPGSISIRQSHCVHATQDRSTFLRYYWQMAGGVVQHANPETWRWLSVNDTGQCRMMINMYCESYATY